EDLAELPAACHLFDPPNLNARLVHVDQEKADPTMSLGARVRTREGKAFVGVMSSTWPGLLAVAHPFAVAAVGSCAETREVASSPRRAEALAEDELAAEPPFS